MSCGSRSCFCLPTCLYTCGGLLCGTCARWIGNKVVDLLFILLLVGLVIWYLVNLLAAEEGYLAAVQGYPIIGRRLR